MTTAITYLNKEAGLKRTLVGAKNVLSGKRVRHAYIKQQHKLKMRDNRVYKQKGSLDDPAEIKRGRKIYVDGEKDISKEKLRTRLARTGVGIATIGTGSAISRSMNDGKKDTSDRDTKRYLKKLKTKMDG